MPRRSQLVRSLSTIPPLTLSLNNAMAVAGHGATLLNNRHVELSPGTLLELGKMVAGYLIVDQALRQAANPAVLEDSDEESDEEEEDLIEICLYNVRVANRNRVSADEVCSILTRLKFRGICSHDIKVKHGKARSGMRAGVYQVKIEVSGSTRTILEQFATNSSYLGEMYTKNWNAFNSDYTKYMQIMTTTGRASLALCACMAEMDQELRRRSATKVKYTPTSVRWKLQSQHTMGLQRVLQSEYVDVARIAYSNLKNEGKREMRKFGRRCGFESWENPRNSSSA